MSNTLYRYAVCQWLESNIYVVKCFTTNTKQMTSDLYNNCLLIECSPNSQVKAGWNYNSSTNTFTKDGLEYNNTSGTGGTALPEEVIAGKTFTNDKGSQTGTLEVVEDFTKTLTAQNQEFAISKGFHSGNSKVKVNIPNLSPENVKSGVSVGGITGIFTNDATITSDKVLEGFSGYANGERIDGSMKSNIANNISLTNNGDSYTIPKGYHDGNGIVTSIYPSTRDVDTSGNYKLFNSMPSLKHTVNLDTNGCTVNYTFFTISCEQVCDIIIGCDNTNIRAITIIKDSSSSDTFVWKNSLKETSLMSFGDKYVLTTPYRYLCIYNPDKANIVFSLNEEGTKEVSFFTYLN